MQPNSSTTAATPEANIQTKVSSKPDVVDVTVHPLVLLSTADHYHRVARNSQRRVVGVLLGSVYKGRVDATNSFAVPFEEDRKNPAVFYLDHNYLENMLAMFRKVNAKERVVGFYSTGPQIRPNDLRIHSLIKRFLPAGTPTPPVFVIVDVRPDRQSIPTTAYRVVEELDATDSKKSTASSSSSGGQVHKTFAHVPSLIGAMEAEEVGVEHLLRDINDPTISTVASLIKAKMAGLDTLTDKLVEMKDYLEAVLRGDMKVNQEIVANMQTILNLLPNLNVEELVKAMLVKTNDFHMVIYLSSMIRSVMALHDLISNKIKFMDKDDVLEGGDASSSSVEAKKDEKEGEEKKDDETQSAKTKS